MQTFSSALLVLALVASASAVNKIKCFTCSSETDPNCHDPINTEKLEAKECNGENSLLGQFNKGLKGIGSLLGLDKTPQIETNYVCLKGSYSSTKNGKEEKMVARSCAPEGIKFCDSIKSTLKSQGYENIFCEECTTDACNGSSSIRAVVFIFLPTIAVLLSSGIF